MLPGIISPQADWIEKSFQLAFFILRDRKSAIETVKRSLDQFDPQKRKERERTYWRKKHLRQRLTKVSRADSDILQWLIYAVASQYEKLQEQLGDVTAGVMLIRYVKYLVQLATGLTSFHLNVGLQRILRSYDTAETQKLYEVVTDRQMNTDVYRRAKKTLMAKLQARFGSVLRAVPAKYGEVRFVAQQEQDSWVELVNECLREFTPWSTEGACLLPANFDFTHHVLPRLLSGAGAKKSDYDIIETHRFHAFLDPVCFSRLTRALHLAPPQDRLSVPEFFLNNKNNDDDMQPAVRRHPNAPPLNEEERATIHEYLEEQDLSRGRASPTILRVTVDGVERLYVRLDEDCEHQFGLEEGDNLIGIWTQDTAEELLLANHRILYGAWDDFLPFDGPVFASEGRKLDLHISPQTENGSELQRAMVTLTCGPRAAMPSHHSWEPSSWLVLLPKYAFLGAVFLAIGWWMAVGRHQQQQALQQAAVERLERELASERAQHLAVQNPAVPGGPGAIGYKLLHSLASRDEGNAGLVKVLLPQQPAIITFELAAGNLRHQRYRAVLRPFLDHNEILAETLTQPEEATKTLTLKFLVPSSLLSPGRDYTIDLTYLTPRGQAHEVDAFSFQTVKNNGKE